MDAGRGRTQTRGVAEDPKDVYTWLNRSDVLRMMGDRDGALADAMKAIETDAKNPYGYLIAAELYDEMGEQEQARTYFANSMPLSRRQLAGSRTRIWNPWISAPMRSGSRSRRKCARKTKSLCVRRQTKKAARQTAANKKGAAEPRLSHYAHLRQRA